MRNPIGRPGKHMNASVTRLATASTSIPSPELNAAGHVAVAGAADTARSGPPRPRSVDTITSLSPARAALKAHQEKTTQLEATLAKAGRPVNRLRELLTQAQTELAAASARQNRADHSYAAEVAAAARAGHAVVLPPPAPIMEIQTTIQLAQGSITGFRLALEECTADQVKATEALQAHQARAEDLLLAVLIEQHHERLRIYSDAYAKTVTAEENLRSLHAAVGEKGRFLEEQQAGRGLPALPGAAENFDSSPVRVRKARQDRRECPDPKPRQPAEVPDMASWPAT
jgi:hypothetical protein